MKKRNEKLQTIFCIMDISIVITSYPSVSLEIVHSTIFVFYIKICIKPIHATKEGTVISSNLFLFKDDFD